MKCLLTILLAMFCVACAGVATPTPLPPAATPTALPAATSPAEASATPVLPAATATVAPPAAATATPAPPATDTPAPDVTATPMPVAPDTPAPPAPTATPARTGGAPKTDVQVVVTGLDTPWSIDFAPDGRLFLTERPGRVRVIKDGALQPTAWMTLPVRETGEGGLLGLALDPQFGQNGYVYVAYTYSGSGGLRNRLVRLHDDPATGQGTQAQVLVDGVIGGNNHDGGRVKFGPDGKLYWTMGETFNGALAQDLQSRNGKILRYNADGSIPADNPFAGSPIYSYGHRNPQGLAWQPGTGRLYETEHGPSGEKGCCQDEVNLIEAGKNYGWPVISGNETRAGLVAPIIQSGTSTTWAPGGATFVGDGPWAGSFLFTGLRGEALYRLILDPAQPRRVEDLERWFHQTYGRLRDVAVGPDSRIYILTSNRDGRGSPHPGDDKVLRLTITP